MAKQDNLKMLGKIRKQISQDLDKMTPQQREKFFEGTREVYEGLKKMAKARHSIVK